jgi:hypothetical protein
MITVLGKNVKYYVYKGGSYVLAICSTNLSRRQSGGTLATLVRGAGRARRFVPTLSEETLTFEGLLTIDTPANFQLFEFEIGSYYTSRIIYDDLSGNTIQLDGETLVTGIDDNNGAADWSTWSVTMVKNGKWAMSGTGLADIVLPTIVRARATGPHTVRVTFSESVNATNVGWLIRIGASTTSVTGVSGSGSIWDFTILPTMSPGDTITMDYNSGAGNTLDLAGNELATVTFYPVENAIIGLTTFTGYAHYFNTNPVVGLAGGVDIFVWAASGSFPSGGPMSFNISSFPSGKWVAMKEPDTEPAKTNWFNTSFNYGTLPDSVFRTFTAGGWRYYLTRNATDFDTTQPLTAS